jgi:hypothetical protein
MPYQLLKNKSSEEMLNKLHNQKVFAAKTIICLVILIATSIISYKTVFYSEKDGGVLLSIIIGFCVLMGVLIGQGVTWLTMFLFSPLFGVVNDQPYPQSAITFWYDIKTGQEINEKHLYHKWYAVVGTMCNIGVLALFIYFITTHGLTQL